MRELLVTEASQTLLQSLSSPGPSSHLAGTLHAGVLRGNRRRHHGQDALRRLAVTVQAGRAGGPGNSERAGNAARPPLSVAAVFAVGRSTRVT